MSESRDWISCTIGEISKLSGGSAFKEEFQGNTSGEIPFIKVSDFNLSENQKYIIRANNWVSAETIKGMGARVFPAGSVVFPKVGAALLSNRRRILSRPTALDNNLMAAIPNDCHSEYLHLALCQVDFSRFVQEGAVPSVNQEQVAGVELLLPPLPEQKKIAEILSGIDEETDAISTLISLLTLGKKNLLQDAAQKEPDKFAVKSLGEIASVINGYAFSSSDLEDSANGIPVIRMSNLKDGTVQYESALKVQENKASGLERFLLKKGDLLIGMSGSISNTALVTSEKAALLNQRVGALRANDEGSFYHAIAYQSDIAMRQVERMAAGGAQLNISSSQIESVEIPVPSQREIDKITQCWFSMENTIRLYEIKLGRLRSLKSALASDLLSGRKRVSV